MKRCIPNQDRDRDSIPRWQRLREENVSKATQMALDLIEGNKGALYRSTVKAYFKDQPSYLEQVLSSLKELDTMYPQRLVEILSAEDI